jgi:hypothetical protein
MVGVHPVEPTREHEAMRLALRTLFWLVLAAAVAIGWGVERSRAAARLAETKKQSGWLFFMSEPSTGPSDDALARRAKLAELSHLSDAELIQWFDGPHGERWPWGREYELGLSEMARRGMVEELERRHVASRSDQDHRRDSANDTKLLIALRRAQGKPDPLKIHVELLHPAWRVKPSSFPEMKATIENVDVDKETVHLDEGCDDRSGRRTRWRIHLTDEHGQRAPDANFGIFGMGGGIGTGGALAFGEKGSWGNWLDARSYVAPPSSGRYQLQLVHAVSHGDDIADEPDLTGLIVLKSEPINVIVTRPPLVGTISVVPLLVILGIAGLWSGLGIVRRLRRKPGDASSSVAPFSWRDAVAFVLVAGLAVGWWCDSRYLAGQVRASQRDQDADWTMRLADAEEE